jgi:hypothetical protein
MEEFCIVNDVEADGCSPIDSRL